MDQTTGTTYVVETIPWVKRSGLRVEIFEPGHVKLCVPIDDHLNHVGIVYAGTHFMLMEVAGAACCIATYGIEEFVPVNKQMSIKYLRPALTDLCCEIRLDMEKAHEMLMPIRNRGKGDWILDMEVTDTSGKVVSTSTCNYFLIPTPQ
jgi:acyl-coenzyme A thioesterase PaaI-like protein